MLPGGGGEIARKKRSTSSQPEAELSNHYKRIILYVIHHFIGDGVSIKEITGDFQKLYSTCNIYTVTNIEITLIM